MQPIFSVRVNSEEYFLDGKYLLSTAYRTQKFKSSHIPDLTALGPEFANLSILFTLKVSFIFQVHYTWQKCRCLAQASHLTVSNPQN